jgi:hypothetical protein
METQPEKTIPEKTSSERIFQEKIVPEKTTPVKTVLVKPPSEKPPTEKIPTVKPSPEKTYEETVSEWKSYQDLVKWMENVFSFDRERHEKFEGTLPIPRTPQKPLWRAYQQDPERVRQWVEEEYPSIAREAKQLGAEVWFGDESGLRSDFQVGTTLGPKGQTPVVPYYVHAVTIEHAQCGESAGPNAVYDRKKPIEWGSDLPILGPLDGGKL